MSIINNLPSQLANGSTADATQVMADLNQIVANVNANAQAIGSAIVSPSTVGAIQSQGFRPVNAQTGTSYTLVLGDQGYLVTLNNVGAITLTVPANASVAFDINAEIDLLQLGAGQVTVTAAGGVTILSFSSFLNLSGQYAGATLKKLAVNTWILVGRLA